MPGTIPPSLRFLLLAVVVGFAPAQEKVPSLIRAPVHTAEELRVRDTAVRRTIERVGSAVVRIFTAFLTREFGEDSFEVRLVRGGARTGRPPAHREPISA